MCASVYIDKQFVFVEDRETKRNPSKFIKPKKSIKFDYNMMTNATTTSSITSSSTSSAISGGGNNIIIPSINNNSSMTLNSNNMHNFNCGTNNNNNQQQQTGDDRNILSSCSTATATTAPSSTAACNNNYEQQCRVLEAENQNLKEVQAQLQQQCADAQRRERILMRRFTNKEQEFQDYVSQIAEYKAALAPGPAALRTALLDPAVNLLFEKLKKELQATKAKLEETQNELSAWKFTPDSNTGKRLMAKCRLLYQENEELGKMTSNGRLAKLEGELAMQKSFSEEVKKSQSELDDFLQELDEDVEGMQSTILYLQQELKATKERIQYLEKENYQLKNGISNVNNDTIITNNLNNFNTKNTVDSGEKSLHLINGQKDEEELWKTSVISTTSTSCEINDKLNEERTTTNIEKNNTNFNLYNKNNNSSCDNNNFSDNNKIPPSHLNSNKNNCNDLTTNEQQQTLTNGSVTNIENNNNNSNNSNENQNLDYEQCNDNVDSSINNNKNNILTTTTKFNSRKRNYDDSDSSEESNNYNYNDNIQQQPENLSMSISNSISNNNNNNNSGFGAGVFNNNNNPKLKYNKRIKIKKSRRSSQLTVEICGEDDGITGGVSTTTSSTINTSTLTTQATSTNLSVITSVTGTNQDDLNSDVDDDNIDGQTIITTRRKSARNHQNGE